MEVLEKLINRYSTPLLQGPAPTEQQIEQAYQAMMRVPDHARLKPLHLQIWQGDALIRMGDLFAQCALEEAPDMAQETVSRYKGLPLRAPMVAVITAKVCDHPKVPEIEQVISVGCSAYALILALNDMGFGCMWRTGAFAYKANVKKALGISQSDHIVGFMYIGTVEKNNIKIAEPPAFAERVTFMDR